MNSKPGSAAGDPDGRPELPPADFDFLVYSLRLQAELNMGSLRIAPSGGDPEEEPDYRLARHNIDLLTMLQTKTKGNLTATEKSRLDKTLTELRLQFLERAPK